MNPSAIIIIPARYASTRFPGKALARETGKPLIQHVWERAQRATNAARVVVATDDARIADAVRSFGGEVVMTAAAHPNGASRVAEAASILNLPDDAIVVNAQGDEPEINPALIDALIQALREPDAPPMATIASPFAPGEDRKNPNIVKVIVDASGLALRFSRSPDFDDGEKAAGPLKHVGLYAYRRCFLREYSAWAPTPIERAERLEQMRVLEHGGAIRVIVRQTAHVGVDTPEQYQDFVARWKTSQRTD